MKELASLTAAAVAGITCVGCGEADVDVTEPRADQVAWEEPSGERLACRAHYGVVEEWYWDRGNGTGVEGSLVLSRDCDDALDPACAPRVSFQLWEYDGEWSLLENGTYDVSLESVRGDGVNTLEVATRLGEREVSVAWERTPLWADAWSHDGLFYGDFSATAIGAVLGVPVSLDSGEPMVWMSAYGCPEPPAGVTTVSPRGLESPPLRLADVRRGSRESLDSLFTDLRRWRMRLESRVGLAAIDERPIAP